MALWLLQQHAELDVPGARVQLYRLQLHMLGGFELYVDRQSEHRLQRQRRKLLAELPQRQRLCRSLRGLVQCRLQGWQHLCTDDWAQR